MECPTENQLVDYLGRSPDGKEELHVDEHLASCSDCSALVFALSSGGDQKPAHNPQTDVIGRFEIRRELGRGAMGIVYLAYDPELDREVAIKVLINDGPLAAEEAERLQREGQSLARLSHPNVVSVHEAGIEETQRYVVMERLTGHTLDEWLSEESRDAEEIMGVLRQAGAGLNAAHQAGLVHRDFKPRNVMVCANSDVKVTDFGLVRMVDGGTDEALAKEQRGPNAQPSMTPLRLSITGSVIGTPAYMAPEQLREGTATAKSDQFAYCATAYQALCGKRPFKGETLPALIESIEASETSGLTWPAGLSIRPRIRSAIAKGLAVDSSKRHASMEILLEELKPKPAGRRGRIALAGIAGIAIAAGAVSLATTEEHDRACDGASQRMQGIWDSDAKTLVQKGLLATAETYAEDVWSRIETRMDSFSSNWTATHTQTCEATVKHKEQSAELMDRKMACLDSQLGAARTLVEAWQQADSSSVASAQQALRAIGSPADCTRSAELLQLTPLPGDATLKKRIRSLEQEIAAASAQLHTGQWEVAVAASEGLVAEADQTDYRPLQAQACMLRVDALETIAKPRAKELQSCSRVALAAGADRQQAELLIALISEHAEFMQAEEVSDVNAQVEALLDRLGQPAELRIALQGSNAEHLYRQGHHNEAFTALKAALQELGHLDSDWATAERIALLSLQGRVQASLLQVEDAILSGEQAVALIQSAYGDTHPNYFAEMRHMRMMYKRLDPGPRKTEFLQTWAKAMEGAANDSDVFALQVKLLSADSTETALQVSNELVAAAHQYYGESHPDLAMAQRQYAEALSEVGRYADAEKAARAAVAMRYEYFGEADDQRGVLLSTLFDALGGQDKYAEAEKVAHQAVVAADLLEENSDNQFYGHLLAQMMLLDAFANQKKWQALLDVSLTLDGLIKESEIDLGLAQVDLDFWLAIAHVELGHKPRIWVPRAAAALDVLKTSDDEEVTAEFLAERSSYLQKYLR